MMAAYPEALCGAALFCGPGRKTRAGDHRAVIISMQKGWSFANALIWVELHGARVRNWGTCGGTSAALPSLSRRVIASVILI